MKHIKSILLILVIAISSCKKETPTTYTPLVYKSVIITKVTLITLPFTDAAGQGWDPLSGPDMYCQFQEPDGIVLIKSPVIPNLTADMLPKEWVCGLVIYNLQAETSVNFYDDDSPNGYDYIGGFVFKMADYDKFPTTIILQNPAYTQLKLALSLQWQQ